jgi:putative peptidoglycan lipid II flippase
MSVATFISRLLGFVRDMITARLFGATGLADAFFAAFRIPNLFRELFAEGSMSSAFIPVLTETTVNKGEKEANKLVKITFTFIIFFVGLLSIAGVIFSPALVRIIAPGFLRDPEKFRQTVLLTRIMFPFLLMVSLAALVMGALNTRRSFFIPALSSAWFNVSVIVTILLLYTRLSNPIVSVAIGITVGGFFQFISQIPLFLRKGYRFGIDTEFSNPGLRQIGILIIPATFGMAVNQVNVVVNNIFASFLPAGSITYLYYAMRLIQFPIGIFGVAMSMAALPSLSRHAAAGDITNLRQDFSFSIRMLFFITIPAMAGLIGLSEPIVNILFQRGKFDYHATVQTASALVFYSLGIWSIVGVKIVTSAFYSMKDTKTPFRVLIVAFTCNIIFSFILMKPLQHRGLALANTISSGINFLFLLSFLRKKIQRVDAKRIISSLLKTLTSAAIMGCTGYLLLRGDIWKTAGNTARKSLFFFLTIIVCLLVYTAGSFLAKSEEFHYVVGIMRKKIGKNRT